MRIVEKQALETSVKISTQEHSQQKTEIERAQQSEQNQS